MVESEVFLSGLECDSCSRAVSRIVAYSGGKVKSVDLTSGRVVFDSNDAEAVKAALVDGGYGIGEASKRGDASRVFSILSKLFSSDASFANERAIVVASVFSVLLSLVFSFVLVQVGLVRVDFLGLLVLASIGISAVSAVIIHYRGLGEPLSCMSGMMVGMTLGMMAGFLSGAVFGATSGMFYGSVFGMFFGMGAGAFAGVKTGVMGLLEGLMAGVMAGTMGAMISVMLLRTEVLPFLAILFASSVLILLGLSYMMLREAGGVSKPVNIPFVVAVNASVFIVVILLIVFGPKSGLYL